MGLRELRQRFPLANRRPLLITEVTRMSQAVCVAAYDLHGGRIVRPLPPVAANWPDAEYTAGRITVGTVFGMTPIDPQPQSAYRHATEDCRLSGDPARLGILPVGEVIDALRPTVDPNVDAIFAGNLRDRAYVEERARCRSLGAVMIDAAHARASYTIRNNRTRLRLTFTDAAGAIYEVGVTDMEAHQTLAQAGTNAAVAYIEDRLNRHGRHTEVMLRLGLARAFSGIMNYNPMRAYLQCNGLLVS